MLIDVNQITAISVTNAKVGLATTTITLTGAPNGEGTYMAAFAPDQQCNTAAKRVGASLLSTGANTLPPVTFKTIAVYVLCFSTDAVTFVQQQTPVMTVAAGMVLCAF